MSFRSTVAGFVTAAFAASAQAEEFPLAEPPPFGTTVGLYDDVRIITSPHQPDPSLGANGILVVCPDKGGTLTSIFSEKERAVAVLYSNTREETADMLSFRNGMDPTDTTNIPHVNMALIDDQNKIYASHNFAEASKLLEQRLDGKISQTGSDPHSPQLHAAIRKHIEGFCFSNF